MGAMFDKAEFHSTQSKTLGVCHLHVATAGATLDAGTLSLTACMSAHAWVRVMSAVNVLRMCISSVLEKVLRQWVQCIHMCTVETTTYVADKIIELDSHVAIDANEPEIVLPCHTPFHHSHSYYKANALRTRYSPQICYRHPKPLMNFKVHLQQKSETCHIGSNGVASSHATLTTSSTTSSTTSTWASSSITYVLHSVLYYISMCKHLTSDNISIYHT